MILVITRCDLRVAAEVARALRLVPLLSVEVDGAKTKVIA